jgi:methyl coenzyme M reductase subunit D
MREPDDGGTALLRSDSIFPQQRLLIRQDVESFLTEAFHRSGIVRAVLHGLPGVG